MAAWEAEVGSRQPKILGRLGGIAKKQALFIFSSVKMVLKLPCVHSSVLSSCAAAACLLSAAVFLVRKLGYLMNTNLYRTNILSK